MKNLEVDIYKAIRRNNAIVWGLVVAFLIAMLFGSVVLLRIYKYQMNHTLTLDKNGQVLPLTWIPRHESLEIEMKHHVEMFLKYFYEYDRYNWQTQVDKALWLSDESVEKIFLKREEEGWFNEVNNLGTRQSIHFETDSIKISGVKEPFSFDIPAVLVIENASQRNIYQFRATGKLLIVNRNYPFNPHGVLITRYREIQKKLIKREENGER